MIELSEISIFPKIHRLFFSYNIIHLFRKKRHRPYTPSFGMRT